MNAGAKHVTIEGAVCIQPYRTDYPTLIVIGDTEIKNRSADTLLSEADLGANYNFFPAIYASVGDEDMNDTYPNTIQGLVHIVGLAKFKETARIEGVIVCESEAVVEGDITIVHDAMLYASPPEGYTYIRKMIVSPRSYCQIIDD